MSRPVTRPTEGAPPLPQRWLPVARCFAGVAPAPPPATQLAPAMDYRRNASASGSVCSRQGAPCGTCRGRTDGLALNWPDCAEVSAGCSVPPQARGSDLAAPANTPDRCWRVVSETDRRREERPPGGPTVWVFPASRPAVPPEGFLGRRGPRRVVVASSGGAERLGGLGNDGDSAELIDHHAAFRPIPHTWLRLQCCVNGRPRICLSCCSTASS